MSAGSTRSGGGSGSSTSSASPARRSSFFSTGFPPIMTLPSEKLTSSREREILPDRNAASALSARMGSDPSGWTYVRRSGIFSASSEQILRV